ncbi:MAG: hypothetical protein ABIO16_16840, partial [Nocardioides sp.]
MSTRRTVLGWAAGLACTVLVVGGFALGVHLSNLHNGLLAASFTAVALVVLRQRPGHPEGRLFLAVGLVQAVMFFGRQYGLDGDALAGQRSVAWFGVWPLALAQALAGLALMSFPTGRLPARLWRGVAAAMLAVAVLLSSVSALWPVEYVATGLAVPPLVELPGTPSVQP